LPTVTGPHWTADRYAEGIRATAGLFPDPALNLLLEVEGTVERASRRVRLQVDRAEGRHEPIAQVLVERAAMLEDNGATAPLKAPQQGERFLGRERFGELIQALSKNKDPGVPATVVDKGVAGQRISTEN
jgi:hypothetical protein